MSRRTKRLTTVARATRGITFDTGILIALERRHAGALALLRACWLSRATVTILQLSWLNGGGGHIALCWRAVW